MQTGFRFRLSSRSVVLASDVGINLHCGADGGLDGLQLQAPVDQHPNTFHAFLCREVRHFHLDYVLLLYSEYTLVCWNINGGPCMARRFHETLYSNNAGKLDTTTRSADFVLLRDNLLVENIHALCALSQRGVGRRNHFQTRGSVFA